MRVVLCLHSGLSEFLITRRCLPGLCALYWRPVFFRDWLRASGRRLFWSVGDRSESGNIIACCRFIILSLIFVPCKCDLWNASPAKSPDGRSVWQHATRDGERRQSGRKFSWGLVWGALLAMRSNDRESFASSAGRFGFACTRSRNVLVVSPRNAVSRVCILLYMLLISPGDGILIVYHLNSG